MGNIRRAQDRVMDAIDFHKRAVTNLRAIIGDRHEFTANCSYTLAKDYVLTDETEKALEAIEFALPTYTKEYQYPQLARALWKKGTLLQRQGEVLKAKEATDKAMKLRKVIAPTDRRPVEELRDQDWDKLCFYYAR
jgi:tetratricopeptide (TPR) repeat protein